MLSDRARERDLNRRGLPLGRSAGSERCPKERVGLQPQSARLGGWIDIAIAPPCQFITVKIKLAMVCPA